MAPQLLSLLFGPTYRRFRFYAAFFSYGLILVLGSIPNARAEVGLVASGLVLHSVAYAVITFLLVTGSSRAHLGRSVQAVLIVVAMGAVDEGVQSFLPYRTGAISDWVVDCVAGSVMAAILYFFQPRTVGRHVGNRSEGNRSR